SASGALLDPPRPGWSRGSAPTGRRHGQRGWEAWTLRLQGEIAAHPDPVVAGRCFRAAMTLAEDRGMRPLVAHCHAGLATLARRRGDVGAFDRHAEAATGMYREMGMTHWLARSSAGWRA